MLGAEMKVMVLSSLQNLHLAGVIHGDVELRNAVYRSTDHSILWSILTWPNFGTI